MKQEDADAACDAYVSHSIPVLERDLLLLNDVS